jgi:hypothetical protein
LTADNSLNLEPNAHPSAQNPLTLPTNYQWSSTARGERNGR